MPSLSFQEFQGGLDRRRSQAITGPNVLWVLNNAYITTGRVIRKRPCLRRVATLEAGTVGLRSAGGVLNTFYAQGTITHANPLFVANKAVHPTNAALVPTVAHYGENFNNFLYAAVEYNDGSIKHHYFDGAAPGATHIVDANCPNSKQVAKLQQKIYAASGEVVRFCKTSTPRDWTTANDAGDLAAGTNAAGSSTVTAIGEFRKMLGVFFADSTQIWSVDADPANNALNSTANGIGTTYSKSPATLSGDLIFLGKAGFRSLSLIALTNNLQENDVGSAIDKLRTEVADADDPISVYYPALGQLWTINGSRVYVYSFSRSVKLSAWSTFDLAVNADAAAVLSNDLYIRSGNDVYIVDPNSFSDNGNIPLVSVEMYYQDAKAPGILKMFNGFDGVVVGSPSIAFKFDPNNTALQTDFAQIEGDLRPGQLYPMEVTATSIAPVFTHQADEAFQLDQLNCYYSLLGPQ